MAAALQEVSALLVQQLQAATGGSILELVKLSVGLGYVEERITAKAAPGVPSRADVEVLLEISLRHLKFIIFL